MGAADFSERLLGRRQAAVETGRLVAPARRRAAALALQAVGAFAAARLIGLGALLVVGTAQGKQPANLIVAADGPWYGLVTEEGYYRIWTTPASRFAIAFFPGYPALTRPLLGLGFPLAGMIVTLLSGAVAAALIALLVGRFADGRTAVLSAGLWSAQPAAFVLDHTYSEATFTAFVAASLLALAGRRWVLAGLFAAAAGATRSTGLALAFACLVAALVAVRHDRRALWAPVLAPLGTLGYWAFLSSLTGQPDAWFKIELLWKVHIDWGQGNIAWTQRLPGVGGYPAMQLWLVPVMIGLVALGVLLGLLDRLPPELPAFVLGLLALALLSTGAYSSIPRLLMSAFPAFVPYASRLSRWPMLGGSVWMLSAVVMAAYELVWFVVKPPGFAP